MIDGETYLIYRGSRDGYTSKAFHDKCDNQGPTISIIRNDLKYVFGGFANASWNSYGNTYSGDGTSFLF